MNKNKNKGNRSVGNSSAVEACAYFGHDMRKDDDIYI